MKKTLILWRHAQAEIGNDDFNRPIDDRGKKESKTMAEFLLSNASPDLILSSPARRVQETLKSFSDLFSLKKSNIDENLYLAEPEKIVQSIIKNADNEDTILIVGHNPGIHELSLSLTNNNPDLMVEFSTCSMSFISFDNENWFDFDTKKCLLEKFIRPKDLKTNH